MIEEPQNKRSSNRTMQMKRDDEQPTSSNMPSETEKFDVEPNDSVANVQMTNQQQQSQSLMKQKYRTNNDASQQQQQKDQTRRNANYFSFIKKSALNKRSFEINGRHNEWFSCKDDVFYVKNLKFPDCVVRNLCQTYKYQGELWFKLHQTDDDDQCYETIYEKIHVELNDFYSFIKPLKEDEILRKATFYSISDSIKKLNFVKHVKYYGSYSSKTYLPVSDIDLVVYCNMVMDELNVLYMIAERLSFDGIIEHKFNIIPMSRVPLLKFHDSLTGFPINITLNTPHVMERSQYLKDNIKANSHQMKILFFLKYYLLSKGTNQVFYGGIGSYSLALMVIRFFQEESVKELIRNEDVFQNSILGYLLMGFLERFGDVNFFKKHIISVQDDGDYIQCDYEYGDRHSNTDKKTSVLRIKDHIEPWNDVSYGSFNSAEILRDFQFLHDKFMKADKSKKKSLLGQVLYVVDSFVEYRNLLLGLFKKWFEDYDVKEYLAGRYPTKTKFQQFIDKRKIFYKTNLGILQSYQEDKSMEFKIEPLRGTRPLAFYLNTNQEDQLENDHRNLYRSHDNRNNHVQTNGLWIMPIERYGNRVRVNAGAQPFFNNNGPLLGKRNRRSKTVGKHLSNSPEKMEFNNPRLGDQRSKFLPDSNFASGHHRR